MTREFLLIDDDADELDVFTDALKVVDKAIRCTQVKNLDEAKELLQDTTPGFIFIDYNMPPTNGLECLKEIKRIQKLEKCKIVLYSNFIGDEIQQQALNLGAYRCIKKPNTILALSQKLREVIRGITPESGNNI